MEVDKLKLEDWSKTTLGYYLGEVERVGEDVATSFYNQSDLSRVKNCELMIIGINPGAGCLFSQWGLKDHALSNSDFLYRGNPCFQGLSDKEIIYEMSQKYDKDKKRYGWDLWKKIHKMLGYAGKGELLEKLDRFVLTNMIFFGTDKENQIPKGVNKEKCAEQTIELISILQPKVVLLLGNQSRKLFDRVSENKLEVLVPNSMYHCMSGKCHVLAIKHTAYYYSSIEMELIGKTIGYVLDHSEEIINKECIYSSYIKEDIICFEESQMANQPKRKAKMDSTRIIELIITSPYFQLTQIEKENYSLSKNLMIRITKTGNGYLAIRHKNYDVQYPNSKYDFTERYRNVLKEKGWNCDTPFWLGTKLIKDYGRKDDEIVTKIVSEINDIVELVNKVY